MWGNLNLPISIHALHEESDWTGPEHRSCNRFQSTLSMRRATGRVDGGVDVLPVISIHALHEESDPCFERSVILLHISIHALHEESDSGRCSWRCRCRWISIHALHEESDHIDQSPAVAIKFQSTLSMRRATPSPVQNSTAFAFQSTLSMRRATRQPNKSGCQDAFQSTLSMRRATLRLAAGRCSGKISIHALHEESDTQSDGPLPASTDFNPRSP